MTLDQAIQEFESQFSSVAHSDKQQDDKNYPICWSGGPRNWEETSWALYAAKDAAITEWLEAAKSMIEGPILKWLVRPELLEFQVTIADRLGRHRAVNNRYAVKSQFTTGEANG